jgi:hypothetical protein
MSIEKAVEDEAQRSDRRERSDEATEGKRNSEVIYSTDILVEFNSKIIIFISQNYYSKAPISLTNDYQGSMKR